MTKKMVVEGKGDFLSILEKNIEKLAREPQEREQRTRTVRFGERVHTRAFLKTKPAGEYEGEEEEEEQLYRGDEESNDSSVEDDGSSDSEGEAQASDSDDLADSHGSSSENEDEEGDSSEDEDLDFDSLSPAEQLRLLMEPVDDEDEENDDSSLDEEEDVEDFDKELEEMEELEEGGSDEKSPCQADRDSARKAKKLKLSLDDGDEEEEEGEEPQVQSTFERQQERLRRVISGMEEENLAAKPWMLQGEVTAQARPLNSLLEHDVEFEHAGRPAPIITEEVTDSLENLIKQRIRDGAWDDVERRLAPKATPTRKLPELDTEKATRSLSQVYEDEAKAAARGQTTATGFAVDEATQKAHDEIADLFSKICHKLDSLSSFKFNPRAYSLAEIQIKTTNKASGGNKSGGKAAALGGRTTTATSASARSK